MTNVYTIDQLKIYMDNDTVKDYFLRNYNLTPDAVLTQIQKNIDKRNYFIDYYNKRKQDECAKQTIKENIKNGMKTTRLE